MLTLEQLERTIKENAENAGDYSNYSNDDMQNMLILIREQSLTGQNFSETRKLLGLHHCENICQFLEQYHDLFAAIKKGKVASRIYDIALNADDKDAVGMLKHTSTTQLGWETTSNHKLSDTTSHDEFMKKYNESKLYK
tara:strand:- start:1794 stop:2210 length:417 start_codon:yes stop_codon:yes gene_type:complete